MPPCDLPPAERGFRRCRGGRHGRYGPPFLPRRVVDTCARAWQSSCMGLTCAEPWPAKDELGGRKRMRCRTSPAAQPCTPAMGIRARLPAVCTMRERQITLRGHRETVSLLVSDEEGGLAR